MYISVIDWEMIILKKNDLHFDFIFTFYSDINNTFL